jgi:ribokinase
MRYSEVRGLCRFAKAFANLHVKRSAQSSFIDMDVLVFGSLNADIVFRTKRLPLTGETVMGEDLQRFAGGKGANQAVAAARLGAKTVMIGSVGDDADGEWLVNGLDSEGIDTSRVRRLDAPSGTAAILVDADGNNQIVVSPGANRRLWEENPWDDCHPKVALTQNEIPLDAAVRFLGTTSAKWRIWNPAPAVALTGALRADANVLVPNESEAGLLLRHPDMAPEEAAKRLSDQGFEHVIITLGAGGALYHDGVELTRFAAPAVKAVDTTAAGDVFCGALAASLSFGRTMSDSITFAVRAASISVTRIGAQASIPNLVDVQAIEA